MELGVAVLEEAELLDVDRQLFENQQFFVCGHVVVRSNHFELSVDPSLRSALQDLNLRAAIMKPVFWEEGGRRPRIFAPLDMEVEEHAGLYTVTEVTRLYGDGGLFPNHLSPLLVSQYFLGPPPINDPRAYRIRCCELLFSRCAWVGCRVLWCCGFCARGLRAQATNWIHQQLNCHPLSFTPHSRALRRRHSGAGALGGQLHQLQGLRHCHAGRTDGDCAFSFSFRSQHH